MTNRLSELKVQRLSTRDRMNHRAEQALASRWNELCPLGTLVRYYPVWGRWNEFRTAPIERQALQLPSGQAVLWLARPSGCVAAAHCEPAELAHVPAAEAKQRTSRIQDRYQRWLAGPAEYVTFREFLATDAGPRSRHYGA